MGLLLAELKSRRSAQQSLLVCQHHACLHAEEVVHQQISKFCGVLDGKPLSMLDRCAESAQLREIEYVTPFIDVCSNFRRFCSCDFAPVYLYRKASSTRKIRNTFRYVERG